MTDETIEEIYQHNLRRKKIASVILAIILGSLLIISAIPINPDDNQIAPQNLPFYGNVTDFTLTNSNNESYNFSQDPRIKVVSFFYTKCPDEADCEADRITLRMAQLFAKVRQNNYLNNVRFLSIDFDYTNDTIVDLGPYAKKYTEDTENWQFLIGNQTEIDNLTSEWNYYVVINNQSSSLVLNHGAEIHPSEPYEYDFTVYLIDLNSKIRTYLLGTSWNVNDAFSALELLIEPNDEK